MQYGCTTKFKILLKLCFPFTGFQGTGKVEGIFFDVSKIREIELRSTALERMYMLCILDRKQTQIKHKQADLRGSPKPGTSTEAADCILMEE